MKAIVKGKRYDTATATQIHEVGRAATARATPGYWREVLYRTRNGAFFLWGEGVEGTRWFARSKLEDRRSENHMVDELQRVPRSQTGGAGQVVRPAQVPRSIGIGEGIEALTAEKAKAWVERHCAATVYERLWGDEIEDA